MTNPFAAQEPAIAHAGNDVDDSPTSNPFGASGGPVADDEAEFDVYDAPETPIGVLRGIIKSCRKVTSEKEGTTKTSLIFSVQCSEPKYANAEAVDLWLEMPKEIALAQKIAHAVGLKTKTRGKQIYLPRPESFNNKQALFVFATYTNNQGAVVPQIAKFGWPKKDSCEAFDQWVKDEGITDEQIKDIRKWPGVCPLDTL